MNVKTAHSLVTYVADLAEQVATFNALYDTHYRMSEYSPQPAWELYRQIMATQAEIASRLSPTALQTPYSRYGEWWKRYDVMDSATVSELASEVFTLIGRCAYVGASGRPSTFDADLVLQRSIAGLLHPSTRKVEVETSTSEA